MKWSSISVLKEIETNFPFKQGDYIASSKWFTVNNDKPFAVAVLTDFLFVGYANAWLIIYDAYTTDEGDPLGTVHSVLTSESVWFQVDPDTYKKTGVSYSPENKLLLWIPPKSLLY